jgi:ketosteroid isomerase-like protein
MNFKYNRRSLRPQGETRMTDSAHRSVVEAFYKAYETRDVDKLVEFLHQDVEWTINGPVDVLPFCGTRHGKAAVADMLKRHVPSIFRNYQFAPDAMLIDGDQAATLIRLSARGADGRAISYRLANFMRFRDGKIIKYVTLLDSFDAVEQVTGHSLAVHGEDMVDDGDLIGV